MLTFILKKQWFDKIKSGEKVYEYREYKPYWIKRIKKYFNFLDEEIEDMKHGTVYFERSEPIILRCGYDGEKLTALVNSITVLSTGIYTDLKIENQVFEIGIKLIDIKEV